MSGQAVNRSRRWALWLVKAVGTLTAVGVAFLGVLLLVMWREHKTGIALPPPTGPFAVGRTTFIWTNEAETEELAPAPGAKRLLHAWMWYPAATRS